MSKKMTARVNDWISKRDKIQRLFISAGIIGAMFIVPTLTMCISPMNNKIENNKMELSRIEKSLADIKLSVKEKVDEKTLKIYLDNINKKLDYLTALVDRLAFGKINRK